MEHSLLTLLIFFPLAGALSLLCIPKALELRYRWLIPALALAASLRKNSVKSHTPRSRKIRRVQMMTGPMVKA